MIRGKACFLAAWLILLAASSWAQDDVRLRTPRPASTPLFGITSSGAGYPVSGPGGSIDAAALDALLAPAREAGPHRMWRIEPGRWPVAYSVGAIAPGGGKGVNYGPTDALARAAAEAGADLVPVLDGADLALLGPSEVDQNPSPPRTRFLRALAQRYGPKQRAPPILTWQIRVPVAEGSGPVEYRQFLADAVALRDGNPLANVMADVGAIPTTADQAVLDRIRAFSASPVRPVVAGLSAALVLEQPNLDQAAQAFSRLCAAASGLPVWVHSIRIGPRFSEGVPSSAETPGVWGSEQTNAAYVSAFAAHCLASVLGGAVFWDEAPSTDTLGAAGRAPSPTALAAGRLSRLGRPYFRAKVDRDGFVHAIEFNRDPEPGWHVVFWDWAADPAYRPGQTREYMLLVRQNLYRATPLVADPPDWEAPREIAATKLGLPLQLGRTPLFIERAHIGKAVPVPLGAPKVYKDLFPELLKGKAGGK